MNIKYLVLFYCCQLISYIKYINTKTQRNFLTFEAKFAEFPGRKKTALERVYQQENTHITLYNLYNYGRRKVHSIYIKRGNDIRLWPLYRRQCENSLSCIGLKVFIKLFKLYCVYVANDGMDFAENDRLYMYTICAKAKANTVYICIYNLILKQQLLKIFRSELRGWLLWFYNRRWNSPVSTRNLKVLRKFHIDNTHV